jgi:hypothetical protein
MKTAIALFTYCAIRRYMAPDSDIDSCIHYFIHSVDLPYDKLMDFSKASSLQSAI